MMPKTIIIAEAGVNHNGDLNTANRLVDAAAEAGVDYVKFQTFNASKLASKSAAKADYQKQNTSGVESQLEMLKKLELSKEAHFMLQEYCLKKKVRFLSTAFDLESIDLLIKLGITLGKIPSGEITNLPYLRKMATSFPDIILSTGMADMKEIHDAIAVLLQYGTHRENITVLHCNTEYPTPMRDVNLRAMSKMRQTLGVPIGYSDHTQGIEIPIAAVALGATVIEKHFTLDKTMEGPDHRASLDPKELKAMTAAIRNIENALGSELKAPTPSEMKNKQIARKSIVAARPLRVGEVIREEDLTMKRPGNGISPMEMMKLIGKKLKVNIEEDSLIQYSDFE